MKFCSVCEGQVTDQNIKKVTEHGTYYGCIYCGNLTREEDLKYRTSNNWKPTYKTPPCKVFNNLCESSGKCVREKCSDYCEWQLRKSKFEQAMMAEKNKDNLFKNYKDKRMCHNTVVGMK